MYSKTYVGSRAKSVKASTELDGFSRVELISSDEVAYTSGNGTGRTLYVECPWGSQEIADDILARIRGYQYQPYSASDAIVDPAVELGDGVTVGSIYGGIYSQKTRFGRLFLSTLSAPFEEEIDHEYPYVSKQQRQIQRQYAQIRSTFKVQADQINARVEKSGGDIKSFGWDLTADSWTLSSGNKEVLVANENGLSIEGEIRATSGKLGGFDILSDHLSYNGLTWKDTKITIGAYLGTSGFQMGKNFRVDMQGNLYAASGTFEGTIYAGNIVYGSKNGVNYGTLNGAAIAGTSIKLGKLESGVQTSLGYANYANDVFSGNVRASFVKASTLSGSVIKMGGVSDDGYTLGTTQISYTKGDGTVATLNVVTWS